MFNPIFNPTKVTFNLLLISLLFLRQHQSLDASAPTFSDNLDLTGGLVLSGDLIIGSKAVLIQGLGTLDGQGNTIFLDGDLTIPANSFIQFLSNTTIDGQGHDIIFEDEAYFKIDGPADSYLTLRNCKIKGVKNYTSGNRSIMFGTSHDQKLVLNDVIFNLAGAFIFVGGGIEIKNKVQINGLQNAFVYQSADDITIQDYSQLFINIGVIFVYMPLDNNSLHLIMQSNSSELFLNGCIFVQGNNCGISLTVGHLIIDHKIELYSNGSQKKSLAMHFGNNTALSNLNIDIMPSASIELVAGGLMYNNVDFINV